MYAEIKRQQEEERKKGRLRVKDIGRKQKRKRNAMRWNYSIGALPARGAFDFMAHRLRT